MFKLSCWHKGRNLVVGYGVSQLEWNCCYPPFRGGLYRTIFDRMLATLERLKAQR